MDSETLISSLRSLIGHAHVLTDPSKTRHYRTGYRYGSGKVLAVVRPGTLLDTWRILQLAVNANVAIIMQAANTGLTGGSTPFGTDYDRDILIINTLRVNTLHLINNDTQSICLPGTTLYELENRLKPLGREPHSLIGSSCIGASVIGGICNNSGGALVRRGPAFTQLGLFAHLTADGKLELINHLGIDLGNTPEEILTRLDNSTFTEANVQNNEALASDHQYKDYVRNIEAETPARFNADPRRLYETSGSAGKVAVLAVRLDTFPAETGQRLFYIGTNDPKTLTQLRRHILSQFKTLPILGEYIHSEAYDITEKYGKDTFLIIQWLGTQFLPRLFRVKGLFDGFCEKLGLPTSISDFILQAFSTIFPSHLPKRMRAFRAQFEHHLMLQISADGLEEAREFLSKFFNTNDGDYFECTPVESKKALLHRFAVGGASVRYRTLHAKEVEDLLSLDIALRRNDQDWFEQLPEEITQFIAAKLYCGHFLCHVLHQDYLIKKGADCEVVKQKMLELLDARGAQYPAEHNVGHVYSAKPELVEFYKKLDPCNCFNPGIGHTSKKRDWA